MPWLKFQNTGSLKNHVELPFSAMAAAVHDGIIPAFANEKTMNVYGRILKSIFNQRVKQFFGSDICWL